MSPHQTQEKFNIPETGPITGVEPELARDWIARNFISVAYPATGRGTKNKLSIKDLYKIKCFKMLMDNQISRKDASLIVGAFDDYDHRQPILHCYKSGTELTTKWAKGVQKTVGDADLIIIIDSRKIVKSIDFKVLPAKVITT
jgi:hypothetical protein